MKRNSSKVVSLKKAIQIAAEAHTTGKKVVTTNGCFDILHIGHIRGLEKSRALGDMLIVGVNSDTSVKALKGKQRPIITAAERAEMLSALVCVDYVFIFHTKTADAWLTEIRPHIHTKGGDRKLSQILERELVEKNGGKIVLTPHVKGRSTSIIIKKIMSLG